ncbi:hypothetical protein P3342_003312 [Pyrenophora teres f. teres]|nr:hypothetical protein P3342_003312 [Pyrenophora teres f. teres]
MSDYSASPSDHHNEFQAPKRKATQAGLDGHAAGRSVKRRASKACQCCRARKVRCNVTEHGAPCTNCRLDEVECIVSESRRKKKWSKDDDQASENASSTATTTTTTTRKIASRDALDGVQSLQSASSRASHEAESRREREEHVPHSIYQSHGHRINSVPNISDTHRRLSITSQINGLPTLPFSPFSNERGAPFFGSLPKKPALASFPSSSSLFRPESDPTRSHIWRRRAR